MRVYFDKNQNALTGVPEALQARVAAEHEEQAKDFGVEMFRNGPGWVEVKITNGAGTQQWLEAIQAVAVDLQPGDILPLLNYRKTVETFAVVKLVESRQPAIRRMIERLRPDEIAGAIEQLVLMTYATPAEPTTADECFVAERQAEQALAEMRHAGFDLPHLDVLDRTPLPTSRYVSVVGESSDPELDAEIYASTYAPEADAEREAAFGAYWGVE